MNTADQVGDSILRARAFRQLSILAAAIRATASAQPSPNPQDVLHRVTAKLESGEYVLQILVTDKLSPKKTATASQSTDFEIRR
jgi:hypothetical protein